MWMCGFDALHAFSGYSRVFCVCFERQAGGQQLLAHGACRTRGGAQNSGCGPAGPPSGRPPLALVKHLKVQPTLAPCAGHEGKKPTLFGYRRTQHRAQMSLPHPGSTPPWRRCSTRRTSWGRSQVGDLRTDPRCPLTPLPLPVLALQWLPCEPPPASPQPGM